MLVAGIMKTDVATISALATVRQALMLMKERGVKSLVVEKRHAGDAHGRKQAGDGRRNQAHEQRDEDGNTDRRPGTGNVHAEL